MKGPRGIAKEVTVEKSRTIVYHFTADDLRKRLKLPASANLTFDDEKETLDAEVKE